MTWIAMIERKPTSNGIYRVTTTNLAERYLRWNGEDWNLPEKNEWVVWWWEC